MPIYVYTTSEEASCQHCENGFEQIQKLTDAPLEQCPECGANVERLLTAPNLVSPGPSLSEPNIEKHGFTQYRKVEKGVYEKTAGSGPKLISDKN